MTCNAKLEPAKDSSCGLQLALEGCSTESWFTQQPKRQESWSYMSTSVALALGSCRRQLASLEHDQSFTSHLPIATLAIPCAPLLFSSGRLRPFGDARNLAPRDLAGRKQRALLPVPAMRDDGKTKRSAAVQKALASCSLQHVCTHRSLQLSSPPHLVR